MRTLNQATRKLINDYYNRPKNVSLAEFCKANNIKVYYMRRLLELYGQKLLPALRDVAKRTIFSNNQNSAEERLSILNECSNFIAVEVSNQEQVKLKTKSRTCIEFERDRLRLLLDIAMMPYTTKGLKAIRSAQQEVSHAR